MGKEELVSYSDAPWAVGLQALATDKDDYLEEVHSITSPFLTSPALPSTTAIEIPSHDTERVLFPPSLEDLSPKSLSIDSGALHISSLRRSTRTLKLNSKVVQTRKHPLHASPTGGLTKQRPALLPFRPQLGPLPPLPKYFYDEDRLSRRREDDMDSSHAALDYSDFRQHIMSQIIAPADVDGDNIISVAEILGSGQSQRARQVIATTTKFIAETNSQTMAAQKLSHLDIAASYVPRLRDSHQESQGEAPGYAAPWWEDGPELSLAEYWARRQTPSPRKTSKKKAEEESEEGVVIQAHEIQEHCEIVGVFIISSFGHLGRFILPTFYKSAQR
ncbi:hypothetical protein L198_05682 [Cryptococcus wingfieldii CBS 7118]|uniref:EF-hand domain-containing protein n=1 Tax=Cryptococcus wingfieldii CBS 7118 TaxID=1295528 RepID=A0A1E3ITR8_9TREE|nr:hypothetical protein L198_05682 [Cryptococcus wingfieldii CBS 7118]ODN92010.1 hypothetical protein L198_05682 [Cryptococcus wingfieldii CBS 7118]